jgi:hypothetical protein
LIIDIEISEECDVFTFDGPNSSDLCNSSDHGYVDVQLPA